MKRFRKTVNCKIKPSRGLQMLQLAKFGKNPESTPSPMDDSDEDPDYTPEKENLPLKAFFNFSDKNTSAKETKKKRKICEHELGDIFPSPEDFEWLLIDKENIDLVDIRTKIFENREENYNNNINKLVNIAENQSPKNYVFHPGSSDRDIIVTNDSDHNELEIQEMNMTTDQSVVTISTTQEVDGPGVSSQKKKRIKRLKLKKNKSLLSPCSQKCRRKCSNKVPEEVRVELFRYFDNLKFGERRIFLSKYLQKIPIKQYQRNSENHKECSIRYMLPTTINASENLPPSRSNKLQCQEEENNAQKQNSKIRALDKNSKIMYGNDKKDNETDNLEDGGKMFMQGSIVVQVCKTMFLNTLGCTSDGIITEFLKNTNFDYPITTDKRGTKRGKEMKKISEGNYRRIKKYIDSYQPVVSHYNISHAPNRRYLPPDLSIYKMWDDYKVQHKVSYETFRKVFQSENIGFVKPSQDECPTCSLYKEHEHKEDGNEGNVISDCSICKNYEVHKKRYTEARKEYKKDSEGEWPDDVDIYSVDMQKVLIIPKMPLKNSFFVSRLVVFNETFASLRKGAKNYCVLWHEAIMGRTGPDVVSSYYNFLKNLEHDYKHIIFWADNCTAQNKNWALFTAAVIFVNEDWGPGTITFKYFEPGHSFMKADTVHGLIGRQWSKDFESLEKLIESSSKNNSIVSLHADDFLNFESGCQTRRKGTNHIPLLHEVKVAQFRKGSKSMFFKKEIEDEVFIESKFLKPKFKLELPSKRLSCRGVNTEKKKIILNDLVPHMPAKKQLFWKFLPTSEGEDLGKFSLESTDV